MKIPYLVGIAIVVIGVIVLVGTTQSSFDDSEKKTYCVEANPKNIEKLKECWKNFSNVKIFNFAIVPDYMNDDFIEFYYADEDTPYYQTFSCKLIKKKKHYPLSNKINNG